MMMTEPPTRIAVCMYILCTVNTQREWHDPSRLRELVTRAQRSTLARTLTVHGLLRGVGSCSSGIAKVSPALPLAGEGDISINILCKVVPSTSRGGGEFYHRIMGMEIYRGYVKGPCYLSSDDHDRKSSARKQRTDIGKYYFLNRTIELLNQLPAEVLATFPCKSHMFRKKFRKVIISEEKWRVLDGWWRNVQKYREVKNGDWNVVKWSDVKWSQVKWCEMKSSEVMWNEVKWSDDLGWYMCIISDL